MNDGSETTTLAASSNESRDGPVEEWRPVPGAEGFYSVSNQGRIRSEPLPRKVPGRQRGRVLTPSCDSKGYAIFKVMIPGHPARNVKVHRAVAAAFLGEAGAGLQVNHKNGIKTDNRLENLEYVTCLDNIRHCWETGLHDADHCRGSANRLSKLSEDDVRTIRQLHPVASSSELASRFRVSKTNISYIVRRKTWQHV